MYKKKQMDNEKYNEVIRKAIKKYYLGYTLINFCLFDVVILVAGWILMKTTNPDIIYLLPLILIIQTTIFIYSIKKQVEESVGRSGYALKDNLEFNDDGILYVSHNIEVNVRWQAVKDINIYEEYFKITYKDLERACILLFLYDEFDEEKDKIISDMEKYSKVRRR